MIFIKNIKISLLIIVVLFFNKSIYSQSKNHSLEDGINNLSVFIASEQFSKMRKNLNDLDLVDSLFYLSKKYFTGDVSEALLALTFASLPFREMSIRIPLFNFRVPLKLPTVNEKLFYERKKNLPGKIFFDSPQAGFEDKDKLSHFFSNAFLSYNISFINLSKFLGIMVEIFEDQFKVSGGIDFKDIRTNHLGELFGIAIKKNKNLYPSEILKMYNLFYFYYYF